ncbi:uncharacterized protein METZ01_LOCUS445470, partial [marine metagenome]
SENQTIQELVFADKKVAKFTDGKTILKVIVVPNKLVNVVIE